MKTKLIAGGAVALWLVAGVAQAMTVQEFLTTANAIPQNPTALLRSDTRRLMGEFRGAVVTVRTEQNQAKAGGRQPATCMPDKVGFSPNAILSHFNAIPQSRRNISVTQAVREWMAHDYPCA